MSDTAVQAKTGRTWPEWFRILDRAGARAMDHRARVACLRDYRLGGWWQQMVAVTYEQARGLRDRHEKPSGYEIGVSRTLNVPVASAYAAWRDAATRRAWLGRDAAFTIRKATPHKSMRITWVDGQTSLAVAFYRAAPGRSRVVVQHGKLAGARAAAAMKAYWARSLDRLRAAVEV